MPALEQIGYGLGRSNKAQGMSWGAQNVRTGLNFNAGTSVYSSAGAAGRATLTGAKTWTITDGGPT